MTAWWLAAGVALVGCKAGTIAVHTGSDAGADAGADAGTDVDAGGDAGGDADADAGADAGGDARVDAGPDAGADTGGGDGDTTGASCSNPKPAWLLCEDFERGDGDFDAWLALSDFISGVGVDDRGRVRLSSDRPHSGTWSVYMPAETASGHRGASLDWRACEGAQEVNCDMRSFDRLYFRAWVRFADDHRYVHHFLNIGGSQPDDYWYHGTAGCLPNGELSMGTTVDFRRDSHETFFYTYWPEMSCDTNCGDYMDVDRVCQECLDKGLPTCTEQPQCCWGNSFAPDPPVALPVGRWFCLEMMMQANTPGAEDGAMAYWVDDQLALRVGQGGEGTIWWRTSPTLALNRVRLQHYITEEDAGGHSNRVWFDDVVVSTERIGCD